MNEYEKQDTYQASEVKRMKAIYETGGFTRREFLQGLMAVGLSAATATAIIAPICVLPARLPPAINVASRPSL